VQIVIDKKTNRSRGFGFIYFEEIEHAKRVCRMAKNYSTKKAKHKYSILG